MENLKSEASGLSEVTKDLNTVVQKHREDMSWTIDHISKINDHLYFIDHELIRGSRYHSEQLSDFAKATNERLDKIDPEVVLHGDKLFALTETVEEHIAQLSEHEDNIKQLGDELLNVSEATAKKIGDTIASINKNTVAITEMIEDLNDEFDVVEMELLIHKVLIAVFGVLILWLMFKV